MILPNNNHHHKTSWLLLLLLFSVAILYISTMTAVSAKTLQNVVITGANKGLGLELCRQILADDRYGRIFAMCRKTSDPLTQLHDQGQNNKLTIVEGLDLMKEGAFDGGAAVTDALGTWTETPTPIHLLIHNAGGFGPPEKDLSSVQDIFGSQSLTEVTPERMMYAFQLNAMAPLFMTKALLPNLKAAVNQLQEKGKESQSEDLVKVVIISSLVGSLSDNTSGGVYGYRAAKTAVNMIGKSLSLDLPKLLEQSTVEKGGDEKNNKSSRVAVGLVHPGFVHTEFAPNQEPMPGQRPVDVSVQGILEAIDNNVTVENSGLFWHGNYGEGVKRCDW